jgi:hypothetical protein
LLLKAKFRSTVGDNCQDHRRPISSLSLVWWMKLMKHSNKLKVGVSIFGRSTPVELDFTQVEKVYLIKHR